jgi:signal peptidase II
MGLKLTKNSQFILIVLIVLIADQITKYLATLIKSSIPIIPGILHMTYAANTGASFSILQGYSWLIILISLLVIGIIAFYYKQIPKQLNVAVALILGGTIGNLIDRIFFGHVRDFIDLQVWPIFNIADSMLVIGAALIIFYFFKVEYLDKKTVKASKAPKSKSEQKPESVPKIEIIEEAEERKPIKKLNKSDKKSKKKK